MSDKTPAKDSGKVLSILAVGQFLAGVAAVSLGVWYDAEGKAPGMLVIGGLVALGGPAMWGAFRLAAGLKNGGDGG